MLFLPHRTDHFGRRVGRCAFGLALFALGIASSVRSDLGLGPWDVLHQGISHRTGIPMGTVGVITGAVVLLGWIPLRQRVGIGTIMNVLGIGFALDLILAVWHPVDSLALRWGLLVAGLALVAVGSGLYIGTDLGAGPRDGLMTGLANRGWSVRRARTSVEIVVLILGWALGGTVGPGTIPMALGIGPLVHLALPRLRFHGAGADIAE